MKRFFEKIKYDQFTKDIKDDKNLYGEYSLPQRSTKNSAGYDFFAIEEIALQPGEIKKIPTGIKVKMLEDEVLFLLVRSSMGFKYNTRLCNQVGIIDADYYGNIGNDGHIWFALQNEGNKEYIIKKGDAFGQGIFCKTLFTDNDCEANNIRIGGIGSTDKGEK